MFGQYSFMQIALFAVIVLVALIIDLLAHQKDKPISIRDAALWSLLWILLSLGFSLYIAQTHGKEQGMLFLTGYFLEKSLSVDNLFVFIAIFSSFAIKDKYQHRVLYYGVLGAILMRMLFVGLGSSAIALFGNWALTIFGLFVLWSAWKMWRQSKLPKTELEDYSQHWSVKSLGKFFPIAHHLDGHNFFTHINGILHVTPLFVCLIAIEIADVMFAFDSVPAIFSLFAGLKPPLDIETQTYLVFTSNIFAILGLRSLYFLLAAANKFLCHLEKSVIAILAFIGCKMLLSVFTPLHIPAVYNLIIVLGLLFAGIAGSYFFPNKKVSQ